ncbi:MAG: serine O-acetyltransferase [Ruminococcaceae bacterium]|nr:serine O-acetyltransferase [Oscillospiraceae bacterium]
MKKLTITITPKNPNNKAVKAIKNKVDGIKETKDWLKSDLDAIMERDPAATSRAEAMLLYSGFHALVMYRAAHALHKRGKHFAARFVSQGARFLTGIEIHPGATIGKGLFIDHGSGVVIGETAIVGDNCTIYQGVTLGGTGKETGKRHPTLGNNVMVGSGAKLLGNFTVGDNSKIAAGAVVLGDVPENSTAVGIPAKVVRKKGAKIVEADLDQTHIPDPVSAELAAIRRELEKLKTKIDENE